MAVKQRGEQFEPEQVAQQAGLEVTAHLLTELDALLKTPNLSG